VPVPARPPRQPDPVQPARPTRPPRTQQQRRDETRGALLDAAIASLLDLGFSRTTTLEVQRRAGVSRGALLHHFPSKAELLVAAVDHLAVKRAHELAALAAKLPTGRARTDAVLDLLWESFSGSFFHVAMELRTAARTDPELRTVLIAAERHLRDGILGQTRALLGPEVAGHPQLDRALDLTLQLMIGAAMTASLHAGDPHVRAVVDDWKSLFSTVLDTSLRPRKPLPGKALKR
jgi:AcrR family transcriptional regulator